MGVVFLVDWRAGGNRQLQARVVCVCACYIVSIIVVDGERSSFLFLDETNLQPTVTCFFFALREGVKSLLTRAVGCTGRQRKACLLSKKLLQQRERPWQSDVGAGT
jgi:hypothetical protein